jgi:beta-lactamase superfamily II metal-dependent hydrolase
MNRFPGTDEIEISIFGPSYGESVLVHVGNNDWLVVDSCSDPSSNEPIPLKYLKQIGVDPSRDVKQIIATHWHDDHIRGLAATVGEYESAEFVCSEALMSDEFLTLVSLVGNSPIVDQQQSGVHEFYSVLKILQERRNRTREKWAAPIFASANKVLWRSGQHGGNTTRAERSRSCVVYSLSPSDTAAGLAKLGIASLIPTARSTKGCIPDLDRNDFSVVLWIDFGECFVLLGSDLEESGDRRMGWSAILASKARPPGKASLFKIPHHGSISGHHPDVWSEMLTGELTAILTPFVLGKTALPTKADATRILSLTTETYITAVPQKTRRKNRDKTTEKLIQQTVSLIRDVFVSSGQVRLRAKFSDLAESQGVKWDVDLFNGARKLTAFTS